MVDNSEKLQKVMARLGLGSRREIERWIEAGRVSVNGKIVTVGERVTANDKIRLDGKLLHTDVHGSVRRRVLIYHKQEGEVCTAKDEQGRPTVFERLPALKVGRWVMVGRLDINTSGLLLFTTDGELANRLMHPSHEMEREYSCRVMGDITEGMLQALRNGVMLEDGAAHFDKIIPKGGEGINKWFNVVLKEGRNREVRRLWESQEGLQVSRLIRIRYGDVELPRRLPRGAWQEMETSEANALAKSVELPAEATRHEFRTSHRRQRVLSKIKQHHRQARRTKKPRK